MLFCPKNQDVVLFFCIIVTMLPNSIQIAKRISIALSTFFKKEEDIKKESTNIVKVALKKSDDKKIQGIKNKISHL